MGWHRASFAGAYNVAEHRLDYIKLGEGREYNYHYNDGVSSGFDKRKFYKRPPVFTKQPYSLKNFPSPVEQIVTNEFQSHPETQTYVRQENLLPVFESHEKSVQYVPLDFHSTNSGPSAAGAQQQYSSSPSSSSSSSSSSSYGHQQNHGPSFTSNLAERVIQMIQLQHPSSAKNGTAGSSVTSTSSVHFKAPGQTAQYTHSGQHPGSYQYFNAHPAPASYELVRPISNFPPPRPYLAPSLTTTKAPYLAPILLKSTSTTPAPPTVAVAPARRPPYVAPAVRPTAPASSGSVTNDPLLSSVSLANQLKYTSSRPSTSSRPPSAGGNRNPQQQQQQQQKQPYEPEFDIDIRIDLRDDSA
uniref:Uncharacterized protein n=2 Tax=Anopheles albimanus TaxID=7167 RepID=A0A182F908_ANOAL